MSVIPRLSNDSHVILMFEVETIRMELGSAYRLARVPDVEQMQHLAGQLRCRLSGALSGASAPAMAEALGWRYSARPIGASDSTIQSLLVPLNVGGFSIVVNTHHVRTDLEALWLAAHEVGHSFFYTAGEPPRRIVPCSDREERFCDDFADELLVDIGARRTLRVA